MPKMAKKLSICTICDDSIEFRQGIWWDEDSNAVGEGFHKHIPYVEGEYESHKFGNDERTEILYRLDIGGYSDESFGESDGFGYFARFTAFHAYMEVDSAGFVFSYFYDTEKELHNAWEHKEQDYLEWNRCSCGSLHCDYFEN